MNKPVLKSMIVLSLLGFVSTSNANVFFGNNNSRFGNSNCNNGFSGNGFNPYQFPYQSPYGGANAYANPYARPSLAYRPPAYNSYPQSSYRPASNFSPFGNSGFGGNPFSSFGGSSSPFSSFSGGGSPFSSFGSPMGGMSPMGMGGFGSPMSPMSMGSPMSIGAMGMPGMSPMSSFGGSPFGGSSFMPFR